MITEMQRAVLRAFDFNPAPTPDDVWRESKYNVPELHEKTAKEIVSGVNRARRDDVSKPLSVAMQGRAGAGKTHLLGAIRETIQESGGYFVLVNMISGRTFWSSTALCMVECLDQPAKGWPSQLVRFLRTITVDLRLPPDVRDAIAGDTVLTRAHLDAFILALRTEHGDVGKQCQDTARALVLNGSKDFEAQDVGYAHLISELGDPDGRKQWGLSAAVRSPQQIVQDISRLMALPMDPTVIAIDQIDTLFAQTTTTVFNRVESMEDDEAGLLGQVADGLLGLREITRRTLIVVSCLPDTWALIERNAPGPVRERFRLETLPDRIPSDKIAEEIVARRLRAKSFGAEYDTWPVRPGAFKGIAHQYTPRALLRKVEAHVRRCLDDEKIAELEYFKEEIETPPPPPDPTPPPPPDQFAAIDARFKELVGVLDVSAALQHVSEDAEMPGLLAAGLTAWIDEQAPSGVTYKHDPLPSRKPALHGRLIEVLNESTENEAHWGFRAIGSPSAVAVISRVKAASTMAGLDPNVPQRRLIVLRNTPWPTGARTREVTAAFAKAGGVVARISEADLKVFAALRHLTVAPPPHFQEWLRARRPASGTALFAAVLETAPAEGEPARKAVPEAVPQVVADVAEPVGDGRITLGTVAGSGAGFSVGLESLRRHTVVFAGSGSGKTVLIRRLIEECALAGVSSIVLDPNNDLARLGDPWPEVPAGWGPGDDQRAAEYLANTDVVVWTPRVSGGRPLSFQPLPDFAPVLDSADEFDQAVTSAVEALAPRAGVHAATRLAKQGRAVLTEALIAYARAGHSGLYGFTEFLADLPEGVSRMARAGKLAEDAAETLKAAMVTDPLFGGHGAAVDPGELLTPPRGKRARVSVINLAGLPSDEQRQGFVNQLQMALFAWIKRHPAGSRPLGGLFVMDEAQTLAPASGNTPCTASTIALASQARKYGLGLVFATQAPKGLHNQISGNATTQFFGLLNAPAQIDSARELAQAKGGRLPDIGVLGSGTFYAAGEGFSFVKIAAPMCLSHHPSSPLSPEEVVRRARG
ncbi:ATP-binding protein [Dactylosporangium sp. NPDC051541]|uniref:ATP-binding protein n=1 Tax=Dactylosporangium sp. NPDC051541 TaxID=3363977 RepID=UPI0037B9BBE1